MRTTHSIQGERWDQLCLRVYGAVTEEAVLELRHANMALVNRSEPFLLPAGELVNIPEITVSHVEVEEVAPWQR